MTPLSLQVEMGFSDFHGSVVQNHPLPIYLTNPKHLGNCLYQKSTTMFALGWYRACACSTVAHPLTLQRFRVSEMVGGERFGLCCLPDLDSTSYSREHRQLGNHKSMSPVSGVRLLNFSRFPLLSSLLSGEHRMEGRRKHLSPLQNLPTIPRPFPQAESKEGDWTAFFILPHFSPLLPCSQVWNLNLGWGGWWSKQRCRKSTHGWERKWKTVVHLSTFLFMEATWLQVWRCSSVLTQPTAWILLPLLHQMLSSGEITVHNAPDSLLGDRGFHRGQGTRKPLRVESSHSSCEWQLIHFSAVWSW